ncbi:MAG: cytochrome c3 family protein [Planctomycetota bacterium]|jgi:predicted CXXCH cytochrome family protein
MAVAIRHNRFFRVAPLLLVALGLGCAAATRYQILSFFFEGVPEPTENRAAGEVSEQAPDSDVDDPNVNPEAGRSSQIASANVVRLHAPYTRYECRACHEADSGLVTRTPQDGLCRQCHDVPADIRYVHGPVAVDDCLICHHHHGGEFPMMLRVDPGQLCIQCHDRDDLTGGEHHALLDESACLDCHSGHGGDDRFFLKRELR